MQFTFGTEDVEKIYQMLTNQNPRDVLRWYFGLHEKTAIHTDDVEQFVATVTACYRSTH